MRKIGILTYFWASNPGTFLQAYSTLEALKKKFPEDRVELVDYRHRKVYFKPSLKSIWVGQLIRDMRKYSTYRNMRKKYLTRSANSLISHDSALAWDFIKKQGYDLVVVGADTILQFLPFHFAEGFVPVYWLPPDLGCRKVACATSAGALAKEQLSDKFRKLCKESINNFDLIGIRDDATYALIKALGLKDESKLEMVPDPTFTYEIDYSCVEEFIKKKELDFSRPTVAFNLLKSFKPAAELAAYYKSKGFQVISLVPTAYGDLSLIDMSPFEWAGIFKYFDLVVTDRFHGTVFSLKNLTPVVSVVSDKFKISNRGFSKTYSLLKLFGLEESNHINAIGTKDIREIVSIADRAVEDFDKDSVAAKLERLKAEYNSFVDKISKVGQR